MYSLEKLVIVFLFIFNFSMMLKLFKGLSFGNKVTFLLGIMKKWLGQPRPDP